MRRVYTRLNTVEESICFPTKIGAVWVRYFCLESNLETTFPVDVWHYYDKGVFCHQILCAYYGIRNKYTLNVLKF